MNDLNCLSSPRLGVTSRSARLHQFVFCFLARRSVLCQRGLRTGFFRGAFLIEREQAFENLFVGKIDNRTPQGRGDLLLF